MKTSNQIFKKIHYNNKIIKYVKKKTDESVKYNQNEQNDDKINKITHENKEQIILKIEEINKKNQFNDHNTNNSKKFLQNRASSV